MIKYEIIRNTEAQRLVEYCFTILERNNVTKLPEILIGDKAKVFEDDNINITFVYDGNTRGHFILRQELPDGVPMHFTSAQFRYY